MLSLKSIKNSTTHLLHNSKLFALITVILSTIITSIFLNLIPSISEPIKLLLYPVIVLLCSYGLYITTPILSAYFIYVYKYVIH